MHMGILEHFLHHAIYSMGNISEELSEESELLSSVSVDRRCVKPLRISKDLCETTERSESFSC